MTKKKKIKQEETKKKRCFVIMPFSGTTKEHTEDYWTSRFKDYLKPLIEQNKDLEAYRSEALRGDILRGIITSLVNEPIVIADLTDHNSNVYWELGIRQSFKHGTITIREEGTEIPFDLGTKGTLTYYPKDINKNAKFEKKFHKAISDCLKNPDRPDSHVLETISGRGSIYAIINQNVIIRRLKALESEIDTNLYILYDIQKTCNKNIEVEGGEIVTRRLRSIALELLLTNRYLDEDYSFYALGELNLEKIITMNDQLNVWEHETLRTEKWISNSIDVYIQDLEDFKNRFDKIQEEFTNVA